MAATKTANIWTARVIPVILIGIVGYATWVFIVLVCVDYLLKASGTDRAPRPGTANALIAVYLILLSLIALSYFRLLYTVTTYPGYVPRGPRWRTNSKGRETAGRRYEKDNTAPNKPGGKPNAVAEHDNGHTGVFPYPDGPPLSEDTHGQHASSNLGDFYTKDVFSCEGDGRPVWCSTCLNFKPDRTHHCREVGRCVRKMDHFCPWVGGVVSETSFKFFVQFVLWASVYCVFNLIVMANFVAERRRTTNQLNVNWIATLAFGGLFGLFTLGMTMSSMQFVFLNTTTIENLSRRTKVWTLAVLIPSNVQLPTPLPFNTITYPLGSVDGNQEKTTSPSSSTSPTSTSTKTRTFAILHSKPGDNPWDLGYIKNFKSVMGESSYDWFLPFRFSPCCNHDRYNAQSETGPVVRRMKEDAGLVPPPITYKETLPGKRRRRKRRRGHDAEKGGREQRHHRRGQGHSDERDEDGSMETAVA